MTSEEATVAVIDAMEILFIPYMLGDPFVSCFYGNREMTRNAEFVIQADEQSLSRLKDYLASAFRLQPATSSKPHTTTGWQVLDVIDTSFQIDLFHLSDDPHDVERFRRRRRVRTMGREVSMPTAEDVIITKLRWAVNARRTKDREDVRDVIAVQGPNIDWPYVYGWCDQHGTRTLLDEIRRSIPPL